MKLTVRVDRNLIDIGSIRRFWFHSFLRFLPLNSGSSIEHLFSDIGTFRLQWSLSVQPQPPSLHVLRHTFVALGSPW